MRPVEGDDPAQRRSRSAGRDPTAMMVFQEFDQLLPWKTVQAERHVPADGQPALHAARGATSARCHYIDKVGLDEIRRRLSAHAVGRHEAARRHRARHGDGAGYPADGRAVRRARRADPPQDAGRAAAAVGRHRVSRCCS